ncbi:Transcriptional regulator, AbiEi antitoxin, Type IV TA system [Brevibacterium sp. 239c]|uniref:type IV toxin-antitoxin system AbiEi family antitoxin n=1 Tax=Brevibacterium sp. 239c TaxID=1965356 RepID=UPI000C6072EE|nr:type IV toxin-antitoxin system AbiEi family antitoxin [Brevibacterium sp. 239c]SMX85414.1 Transcriptional regulator, AbiEi antitoxin, Type IV TA system [Brevibacterium sp. 239c]
MDSSGNASLRGEGLVIEIAGQRNGDSAQQAATTAPFTRAGLPVTFSLLAAHEHFGSTPTQRALADSSGASLGTVNRVIKALRERTPPVLEGKRNELLRRSALEHEWISAYSAMQHTVWPEERFTSDIWKKSSDLLDVSLPPAALFGSEIAAARLGAPIRPASVLIHLGGNASDRRELIRQGRLRKDERGMIRIRPAIWSHPPVPSLDQTSPRLLVRADLLLEDDPRVDEIRTQFFGDDR